MDDMQHKYWAVQLKKDHQPLVGNRSFFVVKMEK